MQHRLFGSPRYPLSYAGSSRIKSHGTEWLVFEQQLAHANPASTLPINHFDQPEARGI
jgi:hypothetical protein